MFWCPVNTTGVFSERNVFSNNPTILVVYCLFGVSWAYGHVMESVISPKYGFVYKANNLFAIEIRLAVDCGRLMVMIKIRIKYY